MKRILKYPIEAGRNTMSIDNFDKVLSVKAQQDRIVLYCMVDDNFPTKVDLQVFVFGTGHNIFDKIDKHTFIDTVSQCNGEFMWHVFYKINTYVCD